MDAKMDQLHLSDCPVLWHFLYASGTKIAICASPSARLVTRFFSYRGNLKSHTISLLWLPSHIFLFSQWLPFPTIQLPFGLVNDSSVELFDRFIKCTRMLFCRDGPWEFSMRAYCNVSSQHNEVRNQQMDFQQLSYAYADNVEMGWAEGDF